jgi:hypothetical protein
MSGLTTQETVLGGAVLVATGPAVGDVAACAGVDVGAASGPPSSPQPATITAPAAPIRPSISRLVSFCRRSLGAIANLLCYRSTITQPAARERFKTVTNQRHPF